MHIEVWMHFPSDIPGATQAQRTLLPFLFPFPVMFQLKVDLAIKENRFEDAHALQQSIFHEMTHNTKLRMVVAMEAALADGRYDEAAKLRDEYKMFLRLRTQTS